MIIKLTKEPDSWRYRTQYGTLVDFKRCTLGKYKGKLFMSVYSESKEYNEYLKKDIECFKTEYLLEVTKEILFYDKLRSFGNRTIRILQEIEVDEKQYTYKEVFYNEARASKFAIEDGNVYPGFTFNQYWNGWECPYFTKETALEVCKEFSYEYNEVSCKCFYDEETDTFYCEDYNNDYERQEIGTPTEINTPDGVVKVYNFGVAGWIWSEWSEHDKEDEEEE